MLQDLADQYVSIPFCWVTPESYQDSRLFPLTNLTASATPPLLPLVPLQLVCFYYVLTTFTTVGYGEYFALPIMSLNQASIIIPYLFCFTGDIYALTNGERVSSSQQNCSIFHVAHMRVVLHVILCPGVLYWPFPLCSLPFWDPHSTSEWYSTTNHHKETGPRKYFGVICLLAT
jgi:hypothetical protein